MEPGRKRRLAEEGEVPLGNNRADERVHQTQDYAGLVGDGLGEELQVLEHLGALKVGLVGFPHSMLQGVGNGCRGAGLGSEGMCYSVSQPKVQCLTKTIR